MVFAIACMNCQLYVHSMVNWSTLKSDHSICGISKLASWGLLAVQIQHEQPWSTGWRPNMLQIFCEHPSYKTIIAEHVVGWSKAMKLFFWVVCETNFAAVGYQFWRVVEILLKGPTTPIHMISHVDYIAIICHMSSGRSLFSHMCAWGQS